MSRGKQVSSPKAVSSNSFLRDAGTWALLVLTTVIAYLPALTGALLWDDNMHVTKAELRGLHGLWRIWFDLGATQQYYPLLHSAFWLEHRLWGDAVLGYHLVNILLHATGAFLVVILVRRLALPGAMLAGFLFAVHPVCVEAVAWVSEQKSTMSGVFYLAAMLLYLNFDRTRRRSQYFAALGLFVLALMTKSVTATLPAVLLVIFWWQRGHLDWKRDVLPLAPWLAVGAGAGMFTAWVENSAHLIGAGAPEYVLSMPQRLLLAGRVPWFYASKVVLPINLMFIYPRWQLDATEWWQYLFPLATIAVAVALIVRARRDRTPLTVFLIYVGTLVPVLGFLNVYPFRYSFVADHFQYLATLAILIPAAAWLTVRAQKIPQRLLAAIFLLGVLGFATHRQSENYRDYETLFRETLAHNPDSAFLHNNVGVILMLKPDGVPDAMVQFQEAIRLKPDTADYHDNLGLALAQIPGRLPDAMSEYRTALRLDRHYQAAHLNLGLALMTLGQRDEAIAEYKLAIAENEAELRNKGDFWEAHLNLGIAYYQIPGHQADAIAEFRTALRMKPDSAVVHYKLGNSYQLDKQLSEAISEYRASLAIDPDDAEAHYQLAYTLAQIPGGVPEAIAECQAMLRLRPEDGAGRQLLESLFAFQQGQAK